MHHYAHGSACCWLWRLAPGPAGTKGVDPNIRSRSACVLHPSQTISMDVFYSHCLGQWAAGGALVAHSAGDPHFVLRGATSPPARKGLSRSCLAVTPVDSRPMSSHNSDTCTINMRPIKVEGSKSAWVWGAALGVEPQTTRGSRGKASKRAGTQEGPSAHNPHAVHTLFLHAPCI